MQVVRSEKSLSFRACHINIDIGEIGDVVQPKVTTGEFMGHRELIKILVDLHCLEMGILPISSSGYLSFKGMSDKEAHVAKRKYRKLRRRLKKKLKRDPSIYDVNHHVREKIWDQFFNM